MTERKEPTIAEINAQGWMHIYAQSMWHGQAEIRGTMEALISLRDALTQAIDGDGTAEALAYASDGEGYGVAIRRVNVLNLLGPLPYTGGGFQDWGQDWDAARHEEWRRPPEPFDPDIHRVMIRVNDDGNWVEVKRPDTLKPVA